MIASTLNHNDLLNIYVLEGKKDLFVKGKQLYECLQGKQQWQSWLNDRIVEHGFQAQIDFMISPVEGEEEGSMRYEYWLKLGMVKELVRLVKNPIAERLARFINDYEATK